MTVGSEPELILLCGTVREDRVAGVCRVARGHGLGQWASVAWVCRRAKGSRGHGVEAPEGTICLSPVLGPTCLCGGVSPRAPYPPRVRDACAQAPPHSAGPMCPSRRVPRTLAVCKVLERGVGHGYMRLPTGARTYEPSPHTVWWVTGEPLSCSTPLPNVAASHVAAVWV